jgi:hypothetical protein
LPAASVTVAVTVVEPPVHGSEAGAAVIATRPIAEMPSSRVTGFPVTSPEVAVTTAVPDAVPAEKTTVATPTELVTACAGCSEPSVVAKSIVTPSCGCPLDESSCPVMTALPFTDTDFAEVETSRVVPVGAVTAVVPPQRTAAAASSTTTVRRAHPARRKQEVIGA